MDILILVQVIIVNVKIFKVAEVREASLEADLVQPSTTGSDRPQQVRSAGGRLQLEDPCRRRLEEPESTWSGTGPERRGAPGSSASSARRAGSSRSVSRLGSSSRVAAATAVVVSGAAHLVLLQAVAASVEEVGCG